MFYFILFFFSNFPVFQWPPYIFINIFKQSDERHWRGSEITRITVDCKNYEITLEIKYFVPRIKSAINVSTSISVDPACSFERSKPIVIAALTRKALENLRVADGNSIIEWKNNEACWARWR